MIPLHLVCSTRIELRALSEVVFQLWQLMFSLPMQPLHRHAAACDQAGFHPCWTYQAALDYF